MTEHEWQDSLERSCEWLLAPFRGNSDNHKQYFAGKLAVVELYRAKPHLVRDGLWTGGISLSEELRSWRHESHSRSWWYCYGAIYASAFLDGVHQEWINGK